MGVFHLPELDSFVPGVPWRDQCQEHRSAGWHAVACSGSGWGGGKQPGRWVREICLGFGVCVVLCVYVFVCVLYCVCVFVCVCVRECRGLQLVWLGLRLAAWRTGTYRVCLRFGVRMCVCVCDLGC